MSDHPFKRVARHQLGRDASFAAAQFEERQVDFLVKLFKLSKRSQNQLRECEEGSTGNRYLTFRSFNSEFPSFPLLLHAAYLPGVKLHLDKKAMLPSLFNNFQAAPFVPAYEDWYEKAKERSNGRAISMVFRRSGIAGGLLLTDDILEAVYYHGFTGVYSGGTRKEQRNLYLRPYRSFLEAIYNRGHGWRP